MNLPNRRLIFKWFGITTAWFGSAARSIAADKKGDSSQSGSATPAEQSIRFSAHNDRVFLDGKVWANPMEDWQIIDGRAVCTSGAGRRNVQSIVHSVDPTAGAFELRVDVTLVELKKHKEVGFGIGFQSDVNDHRANCFSKNGLPAGLQDQTLVLAGKQKPIKMDYEAPFQLKLTGRSDEQQVNLLLSVMDEDGVIIGEIENRVPAAQVAGNVALVNSYNKRENAFGYSRFSFGDWFISGKGIATEPDRKFGPLLWTMYTLNRLPQQQQHQLKLTAILAPIGNDDQRTVELQFKDSGQWKTNSEATVDPDAYTATFTVDSWNADQNADFRVVYREKDRGGNPIEPCTWSGIIKADPLGRPLRLGALTCQNDYAFPYAPVADNLIRLDPDMLYFSGDQLYENHGGYGIIRRPADRAILNYLRKYYQFGWSFRQAMKDRPTVCLPDDHDVFQGNIWGQGGEPMDVETGGASSNGGYIEPARMVNVVHRTNTSHHPAAYDPQASKQDISVYYGSLLYGGVGFAIIADRQWKSGPQQVETGSGRADHVLDPNFDCSKLDKPGLVLLGERQEKFLSAWADDWSEHSMKVLLSQTVFGGVATHHGAYDDYLKADLDCGGWPQTARNRAIDIVRSSKALHINGDQHLTSLTQYGVRQQRDSNWSFCTPAIAVGYPRWWRPDEVGMTHQNRPNHGISHTGEYRDGLGNLIYVYSHGNPQVASEKNRYDRAHQKGSGFGLVTIDSNAKTYHLEAFRFLVDASSGKPDDQFPGWPVTIHQDENAGQNRLG